MKRKIALLFIALATAFPAVIQADTVESRVTLQLKWYFNFDPPNGIQDRNKKYSTVTINNTDFIKAINLTQTTQYPLRSQILRRDQFDDTGLPIGPPIYFIRDRVLGDFNIGQFFELNESLAAIKSKYSATKKTGVENSINLRVFKFIARPLTPEDSDVIQAQGIDRQILKTVINNKTKKLVQLPSMKVSLSGSNYFGIQSEGFVYAPLEGTIKISAAKIAPQPLSN